MERIILVLGENPPQNYLDALKDVNLEYECKFVPKNFGKYSGLLLVGGGDILPAFYNSDISARNVNIIRDKAEFNAFEYFFKHGLPVLGICRGAQAINVFSGGTLKACERHISENCADVRHPVYAVNKRFPFENISFVNSCHRQQIDAKGKSVRPALISSDGCTEAFTIGKTIIGVQFHPERMNARTVRKIYGAFADSVKRKNTPILQRLSLI